MQIHQIYTNSFLRNFTYIIEFDDKAICIDPFYPNQVLDFINKNNLKLISIINTHEHEDHICGNNGIQKETNCEIWASQNSLNQIPNITNPLNENEEYILDKNFKLKFIKTPGHTNNHICILVLENNNPIAIFSGDTLFNAAIGNCHGGNINDMYETIVNHFYTLPNETKIYPGHDYWENNLNFTKSIEPSNKYADVYLDKYHDLLKDNIYLISTIEIEKKINTFFRLNEEEVKQTANSQEEKEIFVNLRQLRDRW